MMVCPKFHYLGYQQYGMGMAHTLHGHAWQTAVKKKCQVCPRTPWFVYGAKLSFLSLQIQFNWCIACYNGCGDSHIQQTWIAQKDLPITVLMRMVLIAMGV